LANDIRVNELSGEFYTNLPAIDIPLSSRAPSSKTPPRMTIETQRQHRVSRGGILGKAADKNAKWEVAYFKKSSGKDSTEDDIADSDFPGTNRVGNIYWVAYGLSDVAGLKAKYFDTKAINGAKKDIQLLQIDFQVKF
jgi:hypothetical protein